MLPTLEPAYAEGEHTHGKTDCTAPDSPGHSWSRDEGEEAGAGLKML